MDPYLEDPGLWPDVHHEIISVAREILIERIRPKYFARIEERVYLADEDDPDRKRIVPDLRVTARAGREHEPAPAGPALLEIAEPIRARTREDLEVREARIELIDRADRSVVTVIEVVSPSNKAAMTRGRDSFARKRSEVMYSDAHWVEIDLLRSGSSFTPRRKLGPHHYLVHVSRVEDRPDGLLWPVTLAQRLPIVAIPLRGDDPDVALDLQHVLDMGYARAGYDLEIDYREPPRPPLEGEWSEWADRLLAEKGMR
jgi:hypothetical protein